MTTRRRAKMSTRDNPESQEFEINNQLGTDGLEDNTVESDGSINISTQDRARGHESEPREMDFAMLLEFMKQQNKEMKGELRKQNEKMNEKRKHNEQQNKEIKEEIKQHNEEKIGKLEEIISKKLEENIEMMKENLQGQINQINVELQELSKKWEGKLGDLEKKNESGRKGINKEIKKMLKRIKNCERRTAENGKKQSLILNNKTSNKWW